MSDRSLLTRENNRRSLRWWWAGLWLSSMGSAADDQRSLISRWAMPLSFLVHLAILAALVSQIFGWSLVQPVPPEPQEIQVELVPQKEPPKAEPPKPEPPKPEPPKPEPPKPEPKPEPPKPEPQPKPQVEPPKPAPLMQPQLLPGRVAERSAVTHRSPRNGADGETQALALSTPGLSLVPKEDRKRGPAGASGPEGPEVTQSERDFILAQVMKFWRVDFHAPEARGLVLKGTFFLQADGTLMSPVNKADPWNPQAVVDEYDALAAGGYTYRREAIDGFLMALRLAQPFKLPSSQGPWPKRITIRFAFEGL